MLAMLLAALAAAVAVTVFADQQRWSANVAAPPRPGPGAGAGAGRRSSGRGRSSTTTRARQHDRPPGRALGGAAAADPAGERQHPRRDRRRAGAAQPQRAGRRRRRAPPRAGAHRSACSRSAAGRSQPSTRSPTGSTPTSVPRPDGAEDRVLPGAGDARRSPPTRRYVRSAELAAVRGVADGRWRPSRPYLDGACRPNTPVNVNTAPAEVLAAIVDGSPADALAQSRRRPRAASRSRASPSSAPACRQGRRCPSDLGLAVESDYFYVDRRGAAGDHARPRAGAAAAPRRRRGPPSSGRSSSRIGHPSRPSAMPFTIQPIRPSPGPRPRRARRRVASSAVRAFPRLPVTRRRARGTASGACGAKASR